MEIQLVGVDDIFLPFRYAVKGRIVSAKKVRDKYTHVIFPNKLTYFETYTCTTTQEGTGVQAAVVVCGGRTESHTAFEADNISVEFAGLHQWQTHPKLLLVGCTEVQFRCVFSF